VWFYEARIFLINFTPFESSKNFKPEHLNKFDYYSNSITNPATSLLFLPKIFKLEKVYVSEGYFLSIYSLIDFYKSHL
jgi:hypothetical protein